MIAVPRWPVLGFFLGPASSVFYYDGLHPVRFMIPTQGQIDTLLKNHRREIQPVQLGSLTDFLSHYHVRDAMFYIMCRTSGLDDGRFVAGDKGGGIRCRRCNNRIRYIKPKPGGVSQV